ncbi:MAG: two-component regulator propeller domain-containing protein [Bacteroides sp.]|nr:two-component regulator propeller domain-containing protein [Bacteroides sp.]
MLTKRALILLCCIASCIQATFAQKEASFFSRYNFLFLTEENGLPHCYVDDICQDSNGYIWSATHYGIGRYDGYQMLNFNSQTEPVRLKSDFVHKLCEDNFRRLWIASEGGIDILDLNTYATTTLSLPPDTLLRQVMNQYIHTIYKDNQGDLWIAATGSLWCIGLDKQGEISTYHRIDMPTASPVVAILDLGGTVCAGIDNQVCTLEKAEGHRLKTAPLSDSIVPFSDDWRIHCMQLDGDYIWMGTNRGLFRLNRQSQEWKRYRYSTHRAGMLSQAYITDIKLTERGHLIVSTLNGLNVYDRHTDSFSFVRQTNSRSGSIINCNAINCIFTRGETIWLGTESGGINLLAPKRLQAERWTPPMLAAENYAPVNALAEDPDGNLWMGFAERGLVQWNPQTDASARYLFRPNDITSISNNTITGILPTADHKLWIYTWGVGINKLDLNTTHNRQFRRYTREEFPTLEGDFINSACEDTLNHVIWFGSTRGLLFYDKRTDSFARISFDEVDNEFEAIHALLIDRQKRLWIGSTQGLFVMNLSSFARSRKRPTYRYFKYKLDEPQSGRLEKINAILEDKEGNIWLGGNGSGLYRLTGEVNGEYTFEDYTTRHGLANNTVIGIAEDRQGHLWLTTANGISKLNVPTMTFTNYTQADGLPMTQYYLNGIHYSPKHDRLYLATTDGLMIIHPESNALPQPAPTVKLTSLNIAGNAVYPSSGGYLKQDITTARNITLHESESRFSIGLTTQEYEGNSRIRFAYRLKGYESEWNETRQGDYWVRYTAVPPGRYTLQVRATDEQGAWSDKTTEIGIRIIPYFYKTPWFYLLLFVAAGLISWLFYRSRLRRYREQRIRLEKKVEERTQELAVQNKQLEAMARHVQEVTDEKIAFFTNITHEFRTPVTLIQGPIEHALKEAKEENVKAQLQLAEKNSRYLLSLVNELMDFRKLDTDNVNLDKKPCRFMDLLTEWLLPFRIYADERRIKVCVYAHLSQPCLVLDAGYMHKAIVNLMSNAIKFTPTDGRIDIFVASVRGQTGESLLYINVCDTGRGIAEGDLDKIFDRFYQSPGNRQHPISGQSGTGIGLFLCRRIIELHGGEIYARNNRGKGASFRILMPLIAGKGADEAKEQRSEAAKEEEPRSLAGSSAGPLILIVEDNKDMRTYISSLLKGKYQLMEAENGEEALELVEKTMPDLIISDLMMPVMDGMELSRRIKENLATSHIPFLMLTALRSDVQEKRSFEIGVDEYLCKPFDEEVLLLRIRNILNLRNRYKKMFSTNSNIEELHIKEDSKDQQFIARAVELMTQHYADCNYNLECFVRDMGYSKTMVNKKMQVLTGQPIGQFMKGYRLNVAQRIIREGSSDINVSEVAYAVGFNDPKYFTKCYKELFGHLPSSKLKK